MLVNTYYIIYLNHYRKCRTERQEAVEEHSECCSSDVVLNEADVFTAQPLREHVLNRQTSRAKLIRRKNKTQSKYHISKSKCGVRPVHVYIYTRVKPDAT